MALHREAMFIRLHTHIIIVIHIHITTDTHIIMDTNTGIMATHIRITTVDIGILGVTGTNLGIIPCQQVIPFGGYFEIAGPL